MSGRKKTSKSKILRLEPSVAGNGTHSWLHDGENGYRVNGEQRFSLASLFSGIGGIDLGFENAGFKTTFQCEINEYCLSILGKRWPAVPKWKNINQLTYARIPNSDVWAGGFPCQDVLVGAKRPASRA